MLINFLALSFHRTSLLYFPLILFLKRKVYKYGKMILFIFGIGIIVLLFSKNLLFVILRKTRDMLENINIDILLGIKRKINSYILTSYINSAEFIYDNLMIESNIIHSSYKNKVKKLLFLGSSCIYPKFAEQPIKEEYLLTEELEETNEAYAIAKITGIELCKFYRRQYGCDFISAMPTNLYGINDNFDLETSHVLPALIKKIHEAKITNKEEVVIWGTGKPLRKFMYVDDLADALAHLMLNYSEELHVNMGTRKDISIGELAEVVKEVIGYKGKIVNDFSKPDGTPRKLLDVSRLEAIGWKYKVELKEGIEKTYKWYLKSI